MNLLPSPEQAGISAAAAALLAKELPPEGLRGGRTGGHDPITWRRMGGLGWFVLGVSEDSGGAGCGPVEENLLFRELGRSVAPGPFLPTVLAAHLAAEVGERSLVESLGAGEQHAGLAEPLPGSGPHAYRLIDCGQADWLVVARPDCLELLPAAAGRDRRGEPCVDPATSLELCRIEDYPAVARSPHLLALGRVLVASMLAGICEATRDRSVAYAGEREQFGRPIGSFQAVKHRCADMAVRAEAIGTLTNYTALALGEGLAEAERLVPLTKALASEYALANASDDIQNHGGTGFTVDCPSHLYLKRAHLLATVLGTPAQLYSIAMRS